MDDLVGGVAVIVMGIFIVYVIILYIIPILLALGFSVAILVGGWGGVSGFFLALKNFVEVYREAHSKLP